MARGVTTEWNDIQEKMGGYTKLATEVTEFEEFMTTVELVEHYNPNAELTKNQLDEMMDDDPDFAEDEVMIELQQKRLGEMKAQAALPKFGSVIEINKPEWESHVTNATKDVNVVIHLY